MRFIVLICLSLFTIQAQAAVIQWNQPEVVQEKLARQNRRVLQFSGTAPAGTQLRIRDNKVKMIFSKSNIRWARIPQKHRVQFPVIASDTGYFSFQLYLPTTAVEIPMEIFKGGKWVPYRLSFEVPESGAADEFKFVEDSFKTRRDEENAKVEDFLSEYDKQEDMGQVVNDRGEWKSWATGKVFVWGSLGFSHFSFDQSYDTTPPGDDLGTITGTNFPVFELGAEYRFTEHMKLEGSYTNRAAKGDPDGAYVLQNTDFAWSTISVLGTYYPTNFEAASYHIGAKGGIQMHQVPYLRRQGAASYRVFNNDLISLALGANLETTRVQQWNYDINALFVYPVSTGDEFDVDSAYGLDLQFSMMKEVIPALSMGGKIELNYFSMKTTGRDDGPNPSVTASSDVTLWQISPSFVLKAEF
jgi:hypothetical protein